MQRMSREIVISSEIANLPKSETVAFEDLNIDYVDPGEIGLEDASVTISRRNTAYGDTEFQAVFNIHLGPKKLRNVLQHAAKQTPPGLRPRDDLRNFSTPNALQDMYETMILDGRPIEPGHQIANLEALRRQAVPILKADPVEPDDIIGYPLTHLYTIDQVEDDMLQQSTIPPRQLRQLLFSNRDPHYRLRLLRHVGLKPKFQIDKDTKQRLFNPDQQRTGILRRFERSPQRLPRLLENFPEHETKYILEQYAFMNFGGYIDSDEHNQRIIFDIGERQELELDVDDVRFNMGNLDITARLETTIGTHGKTAMVVPTAATMRKYLQGGITWTKDTLETRAWDFEAKLPDRSNPLLGLTVLTYMQPDILDAWHPNRDLLTPSYAPARAAIQQKRLLDHAFLSAAESVIR